jgi:hypothetical protein
VRYSIRFHDTKRARYLDFRYASRYIHTYTTPNPAYVSSTCYVRCRAVPSATAVAEHTVVYPTSSYYISWIEHRTDLEGPSIRYSLRVSYRGRGLDTLRSVPKKREAYRRYTPSAQIPTKGRIQDVYAYKSQNRERFAYDHSAYLYSFLVHMKKPFRVKPKKNLNNRIVLP